MKKLLKIDNNTARNILVSNQLNFPFNVSSGKTSLLKLIEKLSYVQIDTISIVERSHHHIIWSRMKDYNRNLTDELLEKDKKIFEYWAHAAAYLPMKDYRFSLIRKRNYKKKYKDWSSYNKKLIKRILDRIKSDGPMQSRDFEDNRRKSTGWWDWKPSKDALEYLFHSGDLMVCKRSGFQKVYDLTERVLPENVNTVYPKEKIFYIHLILNSLYANGFASESEIMHLRKYDRKLFTQLIKELLEDGKVIEMNIAGPDNTVYLAKPEIIGDEKIDSVDNKIHILSPFDNLLINRKKLLKIFDFDFQLECYLPKHKRKYGYFCLPILYKNNFIGRIDLKADRNIKTLLIHNLHFENSHRKSKISEKMLMKKLHELAVFCGCNKIKKPD